MIETPPLQFADLGGLRMGYYDAGPVTDTPPLVLCHGWPELAFSWRHQIKALAAAGIRVIAPDQRGYGATDRPADVAAYSIEHLTGDLIALLDHLGIGQAVFVGHDWGGFVVWQMPLRHPERVAGVVGINTPHTDRPPVDPLQIYRKRFGERMYIVQFQDPAGGPDRIFEADVARTFAFLMRKPQQRSGSTDAGDASAPTAGIGAAPTTNLALPDMVAAYDPARDSREHILSADEMQVFVDAFTATGFTGGINWYRNMSANWRRAEGLDHTVRVPALMIMAENDAVLPPSAADGMERIVPDLDRHLVRGSGHWTQQEKPDEVSAQLIAWRRRRFG